MDRNKDGTLSKSELVAAWKGTFDEKLDASIFEVNKIFEKLDMDGNGVIDYSEWVVGTINK